MDDPFRAVAMGAAWFAGANDYDNRPVLLRQRLYDALYLMSESGHLQLLLEPHQVVPLEHPRDFSLRMPERELRLELNFFTGRPGRDQTIDDISPLVTRVFEFPEPLPENQELSLQVAINENREVLFTLQTLINGRQIVQRGQASAWDKIGRRLPDSLPAVNQPEVSLPEAAR
jgi:hypothetical protein